MVGLRRNSVIGAAILALGLVALPPVSRAADLVMGKAVEPDSIDPHFHWFGGNLDLTFQIFDPLVGVAANGTLEPMLATSWKTLDPTTWQFSLRPDVRFSDGSPLTSADVAFSLRRAPTVPNSPGGFGPYLGHVSAVDAPDAQTVLIHTNEPVPLIPAFLSRIAIVSQHAAAAATTADYNAGKAAIGSGAYRFVSWAQGDSVRLARNAAYWGKPGAWDNVRLRFIANPAARVAALLSGDVDLIDAVSVEDVERLKSDKALRVRDTPSSNVIAFQIDVAHRKPPFISGPDGEALDSNPLVDLRVRQALALAINRNALKDRVLNGETATAFQVMAPGQFGYDPALPDMAYDPARAKALLAEAGYPKGFRMTVHCESDRYPQGPAICQAIAQMFVRIGVKADPVPVPHNMFVTQANAHTYSFFDTFMLVDTAEPGQPLVKSFATLDAAKGWGTVNRGQYSNMALDALLHAAEHEVDPDRREATLRQAVGISVGDVAWIPMLRPLNVEAMRKSIDHLPRADGFVFADDVMPAQ